MSLADWRAGRHRPYNRQADVLGRVCDLPVANRQLRGEVRRKAAALELWDQLGRSDVRARRGPDPVGEIAVHEDGPVPGDPPSLRRVELDGRLREGDHDPPTTEPDDRVGARHDVDV